MKSTVLITILLAAARGFAMAAESDGKPETPIGATATLCDGSIIKGTLQTLALPAESELLGDVALDLLKVKSIDAASPLGEAPIQRRVTFRNGDHLTVRFPDDLKDIPFNTVFERIKLPLASVSKLAISGDTAGSLLYHCTFDNEQSITSPVAGPAGKFFAGEFVPGKVGNALLVKAGTNAAEVHFPVGLMRAQGCIEFWGQIPGVTKETIFHEGGNPSFFAMGVGKYVNTFVKYTSNDGFGTGGLHADLPGSAYVSSNPHWSGSAHYPAFLGDPAAWHHYALVWSNEGLEAASEALGRRVVSALYVDGILVNPSYGTNGPDRAPSLSEFSTNPVVLDFPFALGPPNIRNCSVDYIIDEFKIWSVPKTEFTIIQ